MARPTLARFSMPRQGPQQSRPQQMHSLNGFLRGLYIQRPGLNVNLALGTTQAHQHLVPDHHLRLLTIPDQGFVDANLQWHGDTSHGQLIHALPATDRIRTESTVHQVGNCLGKESILHAE